MKNLLIIGASGYGVDIYDFAKESIGYSTEFKIKGFLDLNLNALNNFPDYPKVINNEDDYNIQENDIFICSIGDVAIKKKCIEKLKNRGAKFATLIHKTAHIAQSSKIGEGCIILNNTTIGSNAIIEDFCLIQIGVVIGHNCSIGKFSRLDCNSVCVGGVKVKDNVTIHTSAVINHKVIIGNNATVGACSFVIRNVKDGVTVFGTPAREI